MHACVYIYMRMQNQLKRYVYADDDIMHYFRSIVVEVYGAWGEEAQRTLPRLATRHSVKSSVPRPEALVKHI